MKLNFRAFLKNLLLIIARNPIETIISLGFFVLSALTWEKVLSQEIYGTNLFLAPLLFTLAYVLNRLFPQGSSRMAYLLSSFTLFIPFMLDLTTWVFSGAYVASLAIAAAVVAVYNNKKDNNHMVKNILAYAKELFFAMIIAFTVQAVLMATIFSVVYLFDIFKESSKDIAYYITCFSYIIVAPLSFLYLNADPDKKREDFHITKIFDVVINYILTPAIFIYTLILYFYIAKIVIDWSLPAGNLAYMVFAFIIAAIVIKACIPLVTKPIFARFFNWFSYIAIAPLVLFWIGALHRVSQYGFTEERVYLIVCGAIMTLTVLMFIFKKIDKYLYVGYVAIVLLAVFAYIPPISAKGIGIKSQLNQLKIVATDLKMLGTDGKLTAPPELYTDSLSKDKFERLNDIYSYLIKQKNKDKMKELYGYSSVSDIRTDFSKQFNFTAINKKYIESSTSKFSTAGFSWVDTDVTSTIEKDSMEIKNSRGTMIFKVPLSSLDSLKNATPADSLLQFDYENCRVVFYRISFSEKGDISRASVRAMLTK